MATNSKVTVSTTLPYIEKLTPLPNHPRMNIRPLLPSDLEAYHTFRMQPQIGLNQSKLDPNLDQSRMRLDDLIQEPPSQKVHLGVFLRKNIDGPEDKMIGEVEVTFSESSWPSIYYSFIQEKKDWALYSMKNILPYLETFPTRETHLQVYSISLPYGYPTRARGIQLFGAEIKKNDEENLNILKRMGFEPCGELTNSHTYCRFIAEASVSTALPIVDNLPLPIITDRLILRSFLDSNFEALHSILSQPEPALWLTGHGDSFKDQDQTKAYLTQKAGAGRAHKNIFRNLPKEVRRYRRINDW